MAFNKAKTVENAQKLVASGKIPQAIAEYQQALRVEPEDQVTLMTVGDLYVRVNDIHQAMVYFEKLAQIFVNDGFISKSIAIYKKIAKLAPEEIGPLERLSELYVQQGVMSEARPIFLQLAELHLKANRTQQAIEVLRKLLELAPDNLRVQQRLAELYQAIGQHGEAVNAFVSTAQRLIEKGDHAEALKAAEKAVQADPKSGAAAAIKARCLSAAGRNNDAIELLRKLPPTSASPESTGLLTQLYLHSGQAEEAVSLARNAFAAGPKQYGIVFGVVDGLMEGGETERSLGLLSEIRKGVLEAGESERLISAIQSAAERVPGRLEPLEWLADVFRNTGDPFHLPEALGQLADAAINAGNLQRAKEALEELVEKDPENEHNKQRLLQVCRQLGVAPSVTVTEAVEATLDVPVEAEAAPADHAPLDEETQQYVNQSLTDVDLFSSYGLTQKGIDLLETVLKRAPHHPATLEKLMDLHLGAGNEKRTAEIAAQLEAIYVKKGDNASADRFAELRRRFQRAATRTEEAAAGAAPPPPAATVFEVAPAAAAPPPVEAVPVEEAKEVHEVDLSAEWASMTEQAAAEETAPAPVEAVPVPLEAAPAAAETTETSFEEVSLEVDLAAPEPAVPPAAEIPGEPAPVEAAPEPAPAEEAVSYEFPVEAPPEPAPVQAAPPPLPEPEPVAETSVFSELSAEIAQQQQPPPEPEIEVVEEPKRAKGKKAKPAPPPPPEPEPVPAQAGSGPMTSDQFLSGLGDDLGDFGLEAPAQPAKPAAGAKAPAAKAPAKPAADPHHLTEVFNEFKQDMGEVAEQEEEGEDLETHYNLGIAYREMGLLEEAIGEFQKVAKSVSKGRSFKYAMQCFTLLGLTFMDKGQPKISSIWYEKALKTPDLDPESVMAVRYDLGVAQEMAGDTKAALDSFSQVYAMNIDYRDVGERIANLTKR